jgi:hypothetical protein
MIAAPYEPMPNAVHSVLIIVVMLPFSSFTHRIELVSTALMRKPS